MSDRDKISLCLADAQSVYRMGLRELLSDDQDLDILCEAGNTQELKASFKRFRPSVLIMDFNPDYFDHTELSQLFQKNPECKVVIISSYVKNINILKILDFEVHAYLTKECGADEIIRAVRSVNRGEKFVCNNILDTLLKNNLVQPAQHSSDYLGSISLTKREIEIIQLIAQGKRNKEIASDLNVSPHTIHTHRKNILKKVGVRSALELTNYAKEAGII